MNTRAKILNAIRQNKPDRVHNAEIPILQGETAQDLANEFCTVLESIGGTVIRATSFEQIRLHLEGTLASGRRVVNTITEIGLSGTLLSSETSVTLSDVENTYLQSHLGVSENGAVWLCEKDLGNRLLPFITQHLMVLLYEKDIVADMHEAYSKISGTDSGYHVFIAGPSKTADIEQSLVIGAHGPRSMLVYLIG